MIYTSNSEIDRIANGLMTRTLPKTDWIHAAHFAAGVWFLASDCFDAWLDMPDIIRAYNEATGVANTDTDGYHETITLASLKAANKALVAAPKEVPAYVIVNDLLARKYGRSDWLLAYWSTGVLFSTQARRAWIPPDKCALPF